MIKKIFSVIATCLFLGATPLAVFADTPKESQKVVTCPVMGEKVSDPSKAPKSEYQGQTYYFCCPACKSKFDADPEKYLKKP